MRKILVGLGLLLASLGEVCAQAIVLPCVPSGTSCIPVSAANPLPTTGGGGGGGITIGTTTITGGLDTQVLFNNAGVVSSDAGLTKVAGATGAVTAGGLLGTSSAGTAANPSLFVGNATTGLRSVSTTGLGISVNGVDKLNYSSGTWVLTSSIFNVTTGANAFLSGGVGSAWAVPSAYNYAWTNSAAATGTVDTTLSRNAAGVVQVGTTASTAAGSLLLTNITPSGTITNTGIASDATHTDTTVCQDTTSHTFFSGSGTAGVCLGNVSSSRFKDAWASLDDGLSVIMELNPGTWRYKPGVADGGARLQVGFLAEDYARVLPDWTRYDEHDQPNGVDLLAVLPQAVRAIQQLKADNDNMRAEIEQLKRGLSAK